jgi:hypothetical protein
MTMPGVYGIPGGYPTTAPGDSGSGIGGFIKGNAPLIGSIAGTAVDAWSNQATNKANAQSVDKQIAFQREQNATQYQRAVADMKAAGLNPALAYQQGGNSSGSGAAATKIPITQQTGQKISSAFQSQQDIQNAKQTQQLLTQQTNTAAQQGALLAAQAESTRADVAIKQPLASLSTTFGPGSGRDAIEKALKAGWYKTSYEGEHTPESFNATIANLNAGTAAAQAAANLDVQNKEQNAMPEWFVKNMLPTINASARGASLVGNVKDIINPYNFGKAAAPTYNSTHLHDHFHQANRP